VTVGSIFGCEAGAVTGGSVEGSGPSSAGFASSTPGVLSLTGAVAAGTGVEVLGTGRAASGVDGVEGLARGAPRSRGVYSVVRDGACAGYPSDMWLSKQSAIIVHLW
jgi:hypothetical protein